MSAFSEAGTYLVQTLGSLYLAIVIVRFLLQLMQADFNNPISRMLIKATHLPSRPLRKLFPAFRSFDMASLVLALLVQWLTTQLTASLNGYGLVNVLYVLSWGMLGIVSLVLNIYLYGLLIVIIVSWVAPHSHHPVLMLLHQLIEPAMAPFRRIIPPLGGLDLSPIFMFLVINMLQIFVHSAAQAVNLPYPFVPGI